MRRNILFFAFGLTMASAVAASPADAVCPDIDGDNVPGSCFDDDGLYVVSEDNCEKVFNPHQDWPKCWDVVKQDWFEFEEQEGLACFYDLFPCAFQTSTFYAWDESLTSTDLWVIFNWLSLYGQGTVLTLEPGRAGDFDSDGLYSFDEYTQVQCELMRRSILPYRFNPGCLTYGR